MKPILSTCRAGHTRYDRRYDSFWFPAVRGKELTAGFDGGRLSSDGGVMLLAQAARRMRIAEKLAAVIPDPRDQTRVVHPLPEILLACILAIACGYEDADDLDSLRTDPAFKLITSGTAEWLYADLYCARGQAENLIKLCRRGPANRRRCAGKPHLVGGGGPAAGAV